MTTPYFVTKSPKSVGIAILLTLLFGPIGLFYASVFGGLVMSITPLLLAALVVAGLIRENSMLLDWSLTLLIIFALTYWLINIIWAVLSVRSYNQEIEEEAMQQSDFWRNQYSSTPNQVVVNFNQRTSEVNTSGKQIIETSGKPHIQDWLKANPGKTINDYYAKFGRY
jgi:small-conductance mechanosensitive channel